MGCSCWRAEQAGGGRAGEPRDGWCTLGSQGISSLRQHLLDWIMSSEVKWSHMTLKDIKMSMHSLVVQRESFEEPLL